MATVHVLGNPTAGAGRGDRALPAAAQLIRARGNEVETLVPVRAGDVRALVRGALDDGAERLVVVGGDGLVHLCAQELCGAPTILGVVPAGTGNDLARGLGLPLDDIDAAVTAALAPAGPVDALRTTHGWVVSVATAGFSARVNARANHLRRPRGSARYTLATLLELPSLHAEHVQLDLDGVRHDVDITLVAIANTAYFGGGMQICPDARPDDARLDLALIGPVRRGTLLRILPRVFSGRHVSHPAVTLLSGRRLRIEGATSLELWGDGERVGSAPYDVEVVPGALRIAGWEGVTR
jgi:diacylglycerol kinase (ATP)